VEAEPGHAEQGDKAFAGLLDSGLKDLKGASSDTRVDDFADRLASLTQAVTAKTANAVPVTPSPLQQPLAMNQGAWTEGLVNRVMYLSSQNLKSADIQLEPAELGRLDIRVNVAADQPTQIHFISGHAGVRDALDSQVHRLRELFAQQGLAQPDVNVADQSRGQQHKQAQQDASNLSGVAARRALPQARVVNWPMPASRWSSRWWWATARSTTTPDVSRPCRPAACARSGEGCSHAAQEQTLLQIWHNTCSSHVILLEPRWTTDYWHGEERRSERPRH
jgi:hypothetical protein